MYRDIILASHESLWTEQGGHLKWTVFEMVTVHLELSHCTVPASQILLRSFSSRCASFLISLPPSFFLFLSHAILPSAILLALLFLLPLPLTPPRPFLPRSPTFLGGFCARCILRRSALPRSLPFHFVQLLQALECRIMSFVAHIFNYSCLFYCGLWLFLCCEVHVYEWVCALSLSFILSVSLSASVMRPACTWLFFVRRLWGYMLFCSGCFVSLWVSFFTSLMNSRFYGPQQHT